MKKIMFAVALCAMFGCAPTDQNTTVGDDRKPVAPEQQSNYKSDKSDPQLPHQEPWWKQQENR